MFDDVQAALETFNQQRKMYLDQEKTDSSKRRRIQLKSERTVDAQVASCGQRSMAMIPMAVTTVTSTKMNSNEKDRRSVQLEGRGSIGPPLTYVPTIVNVL